MTTDDGSKLLTFRPKPVGGVREPTEWPLVLQAMKALKLLREACNG